jgi:hypothetical protein
VVVQQALIHRAEFFDVEGGVVDPARRRGGGFVVIRQMPEGVEEIAVGDRAVVEDQRFEEFAVEGWGVEEGGEVFVGEHFPEDAEAAPQVVVVGVGGAAVEGSSQAGNAVVFAVEGVCADEVALLGDEEEEEPIHQAQQLVVEFLRTQPRSPTIRHSRFALSPLATRHSPFAIRHHHPLPERLVRGVGEEAVGQALEALFDAVAEAIADATALLDGVLAVLFEEAVGGIGGGARQAAAVEQAVEDFELAEALLVEDLREVELDIGLAADVGAVAQQAQGEAVGDDAPEVFAAVEEFLEEGVRGHSGAFGGRCACQVVARADDVDGGRVVGLAGTMGDGEEGAIELVGAWVVVELVSQEAQERDHPGIAGERRARVVLGQPLEPLLEQVPLAARGGEDEGDFVGEAAFAVQTEIARGLSGELAGLELVNKVGPQEAALDADGRNGMHG